MATGKFLTNKDFHGGTQAIIKIQGLKASPMLTTLWLEKQTRFKYWKGLLEKEENRSEKKCLFRFTHTCPGKTNFKV